MIPLKALQGQVTFLVDDLRSQVAADEALRSDLTLEYDQARKAQRTAGTFESWLEDVLDQAAVAWVLGCVFVRFCEDNKLVKPLWIGGPLESAPVERAVQARQAYLIANPTRNDRHWLREAFTYLAELRATGKIFDKHNPVWRFDISGQAAEELSDFFRRGDGFASVESPGLDTRFLGDLYQDLSAHARETYALLQTPDFVEEFILDRTFEPAYREFGLAAMKVIDPTCGSGHFLLGAFDRLITHWKVREPATDVRELVQRALDQVTGVDINAFAVAIARFRLMIAALKACGLFDLETAPAYKLRVATGDSLLEWGRKSSHQGDLMDVLAGGTGFAYATEDADLLKEYLDEGSYAVVVGNPPYITVKDQARNELYRSMYSACTGTYALTIPFAQRFFALAKTGDHDGVAAGWVGQITANSFMKRGFGKRLVEQVFAEQVELVEVIDTSGAFIPGHGTPTVILIGRASEWKRPLRLRAILGRQGEPERPADPSKGYVWSAIVHQIDRAGTESEWVTSTDLERERLLTHPWSLSGGGGAQLRQKVEGGRDRLAQTIEPPVGRAVRMGSDDAFCRPRPIVTSPSTDVKRLRPIIRGESVRDWALLPLELVWYPYIGGRAKSGIEGELWYFRAQLAARRTFQGVMADAGRHWWEFMQHTSSAYDTPLSISFANVATHNHYVLDRGGKVFDAHAPVIKLPEGATEDDHLRLLGVLNSSTACFWLKQVSHNKGRPGAEQAGADEPWEHRFEFTGTKLQDFPLPSAYPLRLSQTIDGLAQQLAALSPAAIAGAQPPTRKRLQDARTEWELVRAMMIAAQEELDWEVYRLYGLFDENLTAAPPALQPGERAFAILMARQMAAGDLKTTWFRHHNHKFTPITELPAHWSDEYRALVERRIAVIESDRNIALIERPECKRRWATKGWDAMQTEALREWLLDRLEAPELWGGAPTPLSIAQLADRVRHDDDFRSVLDLWVGSDQHDLVKMLGKLIADEHVPYLPALRYKPAGLRKRVQWERTWELQRREDAGEKVEIAVPPKYTSADFLKPSYWRNRGKLDVPKERFVSYPKAGRDGDATELLGWAGWDHLAQAQALATVYLDRKSQAAWAGDRLLPLLAGLAELEPWLKQWHADPRPGFPGSPAQFFTGFIDTELSALGADRAALTALRGLGKPTDQ